jgi:hypothetical protein
MNENEQNGQMTPPQEGNQPSDNGEQTSNSGAPADEYLTAPTSYAKEYAETFKTLPPEMRKYLHQREKETSQGISHYKAQQRWIDDAYNSRKEVLSRSGYNNPQAWIGDLAKLYDMLNSDPATIIKSLAKSYNVNFNADPQIENSADDPVSQKLALMEERTNTLAQYLANQQQNAAMQAIQDFVNEKDDQGNSVHPHFEAVKGIMGQLLNSGAAKGVNDAYDQAIWLNPEVRTKLIEAEVKNKAIEADKAAAAGFDPKSKTTPDYKGLTTREILEREFAKRNMFNE